MAHLTSHHSLPPFSSEVETAPLVSISLQRLESGDHEESLDFFKACRELGFFYLEMKGSTLGESLVSEAEKLHVLGKEFFKLPRDDKDRFRIEMIDPFFAYRPKDTPFNEEDGLPKRNESYNIRKDDILGNCDPLPLHPMLKAEMPLLESYTRHSRTIIDLLIEHIEANLQVPIGTIANLHRLGSRSGDHVRFNQSATIPYDEERARAGEHTDFGTLTILWNWLGGLQIRTPGEEKWVWVKPVPGSAVVNLGDALVIFTAGILRSNIHRVVPPLPPQDGMVRGSLVFFSRPEDDVVLRRLKGGMIEAQDKAEEKEDTGLTSKEWVLRRSVGDLKGVFTHKGGLERRGQAEYT